MYHSLSTQNKSISTTIFLENFFYCFCFMVKGNQTRNQNFRERDVLFLTQQQYFFNIFEYLSLHQESSLVQYLLVKRSRTIAHITSRSCLLPLTMSCFMFGVLFGAPTLGWVSDVKGRKFTFFLTYIFMLLTNTMGILCTR